MSREEQDYENFLAAIGRQDGSVAISKRRSYEARYAESYQRLVRMGLRPQIRAKYREV